MTAEYKKSGAPSEAEFKDYSANDREAHLENTTSLPLHSRWKEEAAFFDKMATDKAGQSLLLDSMAIQRYSSPELKRRFNKEYRFRVMGSLKKKRVLDVGCGDGLNSVLLALMGAHVTGVDISPKSIEMAQRRAAENGVSDRTRFICSPIETANLPEQYFDIIWGDSVLHHLLHDLDNIMHHLHRSAKPDGQFLFAEPINLCEPLRQLRRLVPVKFNGTSGERPLVGSEIALVQRYSSAFTLRCFSFLGRLDRFILVNHNYERSPPIRRFLVNCINSLDYFVLSIPGIRRLAGVCVMHARPRSS